MSIQELKLGQTVDNLLKTANTNFKEIADTLDEWTDTVESGGTKAIVFSDIDKMIECLNYGQTEDGSELKLNLGDEIYIIKENEPDFWVVGINYNPGFGSKPSTWEEETYYYFGKYIIQISKSKEIDLKNYVTQEEFEEGLAEAGKVQDVRVNNSSVVVDKIAYIDIDEIQSEYIEISSGTADYWGTWDIDGVVYWALKLKDTDTQIEVFNEIWESVVYQTIRQTANNTMYLCITASETEKNKTWYIRKIKGEAITTGGSGTKKYLHCLTLVCNKPVEDIIVIDSSLGIFVSRIFRLIDSKIYIISTNSENIISLLGETIIGMTGFLSIVESEYENLGEGNSENEELSHNEYYFPLSTLVNTDNGVVLTATGYGTKATIEEPSNLTISHSKIGFTAKFQPANYEILSDTITEL